MSASHSVTPSMDETADPGGTRSAGGTAGSGPRAAGAGVSQNARQMSNQRLTSEDLSRLHAQHLAEGAESSIEDMAQDFERLWWEVDALRFELAGATERTKVAREERDRLEGLYWQLQMKLPGGKI